MACRRPRHSLFPDALSGRDIPHSEEKRLASRWRKQTDHSPWMDPALSHHESRLKPGDGVRLSLSRSHPELTGVSGTVVCIDRPSDGGRVTVKLTAGAEGKPKKLKVRPTLLLPGRNTSGAFPIAPDWSLPDLGRPGRMRTTF
ncbi:unnamed protein product [Effrenium voratum]|uniref:Uncharacterized protein n=1 Tax=Effrenium voratum TaxID=2562239 RepID=A0AA36IYQ5_9DINO|nr:unnamed protein product [Effrenium voratum]CAJ1413904.1 unnamed protein product [Effrenium voratum]